MTRKQPPITVPAPKGPRPRCAFCRKQLRPQYDWVWTTADGRKLGIAAALGLGPPTAREFSHYGVDGMFCSKTHGYLFAKTVVGYIREGKMKLTTIPEKL